MTVFRGSSVSGTSSWQRVFWTYLLSYVSLFVVPLIVFGVSFNKDVSALVEQEIVQAEIVALDQAQGALDSMFRSIKDVAVRIGTNPTLNPLLLRHNPFQLQQAQHVLRDYTAANSGVHDILLEYDRDRLIGSTSSYTVPQYFDEIMAFTGLGAEEYRILTADLRGSLVRWPVETNARGMSPRSYVVLLASVPITSEMPFARAIFLVEEGPIRRLLARTVQGDGRTAHIVTADGDGVLSQPIPSDLVEQINRSVSEHPSPSARVSFSDNRYTVLTSPSTELPWTYVSLIPSDATRDRTRAVAGKTLLLVAALAALGCGLILVYMRMTYAPILALKNRIETSIGDEGVRIDGIASMGGIIAEVAETNQQLSKLAVGATQLRVRRLVHEALQGRFASRERFTQHAHALGAPIVDSAFVSAMLVRIKGARTVEQASTMRSSIESSLGTTLASYPGIDYTVQLDTIDVQLVPVMCGHVSADAMLDAAAALAAALIAAGPAARFVIGLGRPVRDPLLMARSLTEAHACLDASFVRQRELVIRFEDVRLNAHENNGYDDADICRRLELAVRRGDVAGVNAVCDEVREVVRVSGISSTSARLLSYDLLHVCAQTIGEGPYELSDETTAALIRHLSSGTIDEFLDALCHDTAPILARISEASDDHRSDVGQRIMDRVTETYCEPLFSVETVADALGLSPAYVSRLFKEQFGVGLADYVGRLRIERFKELLRSSHDDIGVLVRSVGYQSVPSFVRRFKEHEGVTPSQYRSSFHA